VIEILLEDNHLIALNKRAGVATQPSPAGSDDLETEAKVFIKKRDNKPGGVFLHAVHRLDKPVSGIVVFAKTQKALARLNDALRQHLFKKTYFAIVEGHVKEQETLTHYLLHGDHRAEVSETPKEGYKKAVLNYKLLKPLGEFSLIEIDLVSGRYHQIRAQMGYIGHPVVFDEKYGAKTPGDGGILLHHGKVAFPHPVKDETIIVESKLPNSFSC